MQARSFANTSVHYRRLSARKGVHCWLIALSARESGSEFAALKVLRACLLLSAGDAKRMTNTVIEAEPTIVSQSLPGSNSFHGLRLCRDRRFRDAAAPSTAQRTFVSFCFGVPQGICFLLARQRVHCRRASACLVGASSYPVSAHTHTSFHCWRRSIFTVGAQECSLLAHKSVHYWRIRVAIVGAQYFPCWRKSVFFFPRGTFSNWWAPALSLGELAGRYAHL